MLTRCFIGSYRARASSINIQLPGNVLTHRPERFINKRVEFGQSSGGGFWVRGMLFSVAVAAILTLISCFIRSNRV